ncbi:MAG: hypothetical protein WC044_07980 [Crocinitomicaceae bacterium]
MTYIFIPIALFAISVLVILYLLLIKKDKKTVRNILLPELFFITIWLILYYFLFK